MDEVPLICMQRVLEACAVVDSETFINLSLTCSALLSHSKTPFVQLVFAQSTDCAELPAPYWKAGDELEYMQRGGGEKRTLFHALTDWSAGFVASSASFHKVLSLVPNAAWEAVKLSGDTHMLTIRRAPVAVITALRRHRLLAEWVECCAEKEPEIADKKHKVESSETPKSKEKPILDPILSKELRVQFENEPLRSVVFCIGTSKAGDDFKAFAGGKGEAARNGLKQYVEWLLAISNHILLVRDVLGAAHEMFESDSQLFSTILLGPLSICETLVERNLAQWNVGEEFDDEADDDDDDDDGMDYEQDEIGEINFAVPLALEGLKRILEACAELDAETFINLSRTCRALWAHAHTPLMGTLFSRYIWGSGELIYPDADEGRHFMYLYGGGRTGEERSLHQAFTAWSADYAKSSRRLETIFEYIPAAAVPHMFIGMELGCCAPWAVCQTLRRHRLMWPSFSPPEEEDDDDGEEEECLPKNEEEKPEDSEDSKDWEPEHPDPKPSAEQKEDFEYEERESVRLEVNPLRTYLDYHDSFGGERGKKSRKVLADYCKHFADISNVILRIRDVIGVASEFYDVHVVEEHVVLVGPFSILRLLVEQKLANWCERPLTLSEEEAEQARWDWKVLRAEHLHSLGISDDDGF